MRIVDKRFSGIARGVGTAKILGRVHSAQLKLADLFLPCSFTIMEVHPVPSDPRHRITHITFGQGRDVELLLGLDMLKGHRACIDLEKNVLRIQGREVSFLSEHELPERAKDPTELADMLEGSVAPGPGTSSSSSNPGPSNSRNSTSVSFPGGGRSLGSPPANLAGAGNIAGSNRPPASSGYPESSIRTIMDLGVSREVAISTLEAAGGNLDVAASLLF
jgi:DNA damage-inducible protein 1